MARPRIEKPQDYCQHGENPYFCCRCAGLTDIEIEQWKPYRSDERPIIPRAGSKRYIGVRISRNDCVFTSRRQTKVSNASCPEEVPIIRDLYTDPNSRFQRGGTGFIRIPLDEPRGTRADTPGWLHQREDFFKTLKASRGLRAEQILSEFYLGNKTDTQIAETLGWKKDSVKKERAALIRGGNRFFGVCGGGQIPP